MPLPLIPLIAAGSSLLGSGINALSNSSNNKRMRDFQREMYERQRVDSLNDWQMMNDYNSPAAQMKRFTEAGLNPNLIYGQANNNVAAVRSSTPGSFNPEPNRLDTRGITEPLMSIYDVQVKQATTDNLKQQLETAKQQTLLTAAQTAQTAANTAKTSADTDRSRFDLGQAQSLSSTVLEKAQADLSKTYADTAYTLDANDRAAALQSGNLQQQVEDILNSRVGRSKTSADVEATRQQIKNLKSSNILMQLDIDLKRKGIQPTDAAWMRMLSRIVDGTSSIPAKAKQILDNLSKGVYNNVNKAHNWAQDLFTP